METMSKKNDRKEPSATAVAFAAAHVGSVVEGSTLADLFERAITVARKNAFEEAARIVEGASHGDQEVVALLRARGAS